MSKTKKELIPTLQPTAELVTVADIAKAKADDEAQVRAQLARGARLAQIGEEDLAASDWMLTN